jgi:tetratricopeptide (TPR) repeat protein
VSGFATREDFFGALRENRDRPEGRARAAIAEEIADAAEAFDDDEVTATALVELMSSYHGSGEVVKYPVVFARLLRLWDRNPKAFDDWEAHRVFWYFKWVGSGLLTTPDVPLAAIRGWIGEMRKRYEAAGHGLQPVYGQLYLLAAHTGEGEELAYELWATRGRSRMSDCEACEARSRAEYHFGRGEDDLGMAELEPTLEGRSTCDEEPHVSQSVALLPMVRLGRTDAARGAHLASYRTVRGKEAYLAAVGRHLEFCALTGNEARGLELLSQNRALFGFTAAPSSRLTYLTGVEVLLRRLVEVGHGRTPCGGPLGREWTVTELLESVTADAQALAARFDARNGNATTSRRRAERLAATPLVAELNLGVRSAPLAGAETPVAVPTAGSAAAASQAPETVVPDDFEKLVTEALLRDRQFHPAARRLWDALLERAAGPDADKVDDVLRGEIATERASRAHQERDWEAVNTYFQEAAACYERAGRPDRVIASQARVWWSRATHDDRGTDAAATVAEAWQELDALLQRIDALLADSGFGPDLSDAQVQKLVVHQSRVFAARAAAIRSAAAEDREHWLGVFRAEVDLMVREGSGFDAPQRLALVMESVAEYDATHDDPSGAEVLARRALQIFTDLDWPWRLHRSRMFLGLALASQERYPEAMQVLQIGIAEAHPAIDADELTPLYRMLAESALQGGEPATAVRAFAEAAVRLDREGDAFGAVETRWRMAGALASQGQTADAVAVLETLVETPILDPEDDTESDGAVAESAAAAEVSAAAADGAPADAVGVSAAADKAEPVDATNTSATDASATNTSATGGVEPEAGLSDATDGAATESAASPTPKPAKNPTRADMLLVQIRADLARGLLALDEPRAAAVEFLHVADAVDGWPDASRLTAAAAEAAGALALARNWDGARAAWERAVASNAVAPRIPDMTEALRDMASETINAFGAERADDALDYLAQADAMRVDFAEVARSQFLSIDVDEAQTCYTRGWVLNAAGRSEEAIEQLERASVLYDRPGFAAIPARFDAIRQAAVIEYRELSREDAAKARLDTAIADAEAAGHSDGVATLRKLRDAIR